MNAVDVFNRIALSNANACYVTFIILCAALIVFRDKEARTSEFGFALNNRYCTACKLFSVETGSHHNGLPHTVRVSDGDDELRDESPRKGAPLLPPHLPPQVRRPPHAPQ